MSKGELKITVANNIKRLRLRSHLTQEAVAERAGFHYKYYQRIESGSVNLTIESIERIARALGVLPKRLVT